jgi:hypothetical protein
MTNELHLQSVFILDDCNKHIGAFFSQSRNESIQELGK